MLLKKIWVLVFSFTYLVLVDVKDRSIDSKVDFYPIFQGIRGVCRTFQAKANQIRGDTM